MGGRHEDQDHHLQGRGQAEAEGLRGQESRRVAQGDEEAPLTTGGGVDPYFPTVQDAQEIHDQAVQDHGQAPAPLLDPGKLESAMGRAANYWHYGEGSPQERMANSAGALAHGIGAAQSFEDGNKRTAYHTTRYFLHANDLGHLSPVDHDDEELADHLIGHGEGTHSLEDTQGLFRSRLPQTPVTSYVVHEEVYPTNPLKHAGWVVTKGEERRFVSAHADRDEAEREASRLNEASGSVTPPANGHYAARDEATERDFLRKLDEMGVPVRHQADIRDAAPPANQQRRANILDHVNPGLDPTVWIHPEAPDPILKPELRHWIIETIHKALAKHGYDRIEEWLSLVLTGSLTTYQYSEHSDCDISLWVDAPKFPEWSRGEMIGIMIEEFDELKLPGTTHPLQAFVVASKKLTKDDLYKPGLRSGYDLETQRWIVPPEKSRGHDVEHEMNGDYTYALEVVDKMERLIRYEPDKALRYYQMIHKRRMRDQTQGKGDYSQANIVYKMLDNRGIFDRLRELGAHIA